MITPRQQSWASQPYSNLGGRHELTTVQFQVAFSETVMGAAIFSGQPYRCATQRFPNDTMMPPNPEVPVCEGCPAGKTLEYDHCKYNSSVVEARLLKTVAQNYASQGLIDSITYLERARVYLYRGTKDNIYEQGSVAKTRDFFADQLLFKNDIPSGHANSLPGSKPWPCGAEGPLSNIPFQNCDYDGPGAALQHIYGGGLAPPADKASLSNLKWFDQKPFYGDKDVTGLARWGLVYVPTSCEAASSRACDLFVSFPGCGFTSYSTFVLLVTNLNFNAWAETNHIIVLYPKLASHGSTKQQQEGCWNVYGQTGANYATRDAPQMLAVRQMVKQAYPKLNTFQVGLTELNVVGEGLKDGAFAMAKSQWASGDGVSGIIERARRPSIVIKMMADNVAGVSIPVFKLSHDPSKDASAQTLGVAHGGAVINACREVYLKAVISLVKLASLQTAFHTLDEEIKMTSRRVNALEYVLIPKIEEMIHYITQEMDEQSREEFFRVKKVVEKKKAKLLREKLEADKELEAAGIKSVQKDFDDTGLDVPDMLYKKKDEDLIF
ncbi:unnamed protein product [Polarella glacialis]|uniref:V-type proton ATPase subunit D n=1 Tax=Polarella glacialis TaxID=89957 RepID=A0A813LLZ7_POLGL|nr:unnamed protein product [Polarella glacialis]